MGTVKIATKIIDGIEMKQCKSSSVCCGEWKPLSEFNKNRNQCKTCQKLYGQQYHQDNKQKHNEQSKIRSCNRTPEQIEKERARHRIENMTPEQIEKERNRRRIVNMDPEQIEKKRAKGRLQNLTPEQIEKKRAKGRIANKTPEQIEKTRQKARIENLTPEQAERRRLAKNKRRQNPIIKFQILASTQANRAIKAAGNSKKQKSTKQYLPQPIEEVLERIQLLFSLPSNLTPDGKVWMTMDNWKPYNSKTYKENDPPTWTWNLDHIEPHSNFIYTDLNSEEFRKCYDINNLRPLKAKQNIIDSNNRSPEEIENIKKSIEEFLKSKK